MIVAWQFTARNVSKKEPPVGRGVIGSERTFDHLKR